MSTGKTSLISVILPVYNGGVDLFAAVNSIVDQTFSDWELIIIDDASSDGSLDRIREIKDDRIRIFRNRENKGIAFSLNRAINLSCGKYLARMDHDDICHPDRLHKQYEFMEQNHDIDLVATAYVLLEAGNIIENSVRPPEFHEKIISRPWLGFAMAHPTWMGKANWFKNNKYKYPAPYYAEDAELLLRTYRSSRFHVIPENLLLYKDARKRFKILIQARFSFFKVQLDFYKNHGEFLMLPVAVILLFTHLLRDFLSLLKLDIGPLRRSDFSKLTVSSKEIEYWNNRLKHLLVLL